MSGAILDTHALLWLIEGDARLGSRAKQAIESNREPVFVSYASIWELAVKQAIGKIQLSLPIRQFVKMRISDVGIPLLPIEIEHIAKSSELPLHHRDPFDRLLVAQCLTGEMRIFSRDPQLDAYGVNRIWD